ncbi:MAG TPA: ABC transporter permease [Cyclobacteriaceae bacterium]|jgi:putative ABC transport system permease protein
MLRNYFKVAVRNILKHKFYSAINVLGMTIGVTACILIVLYVVDELSYDRFHDKADRMYQIGLHGKIGAQEVKTANTCPPLWRAMAEEIPDVESATRIAEFWGSVVKYGDQAFNEDRVYYADSNFFNFFTFKLLEGDPRTALTEPQSVVVTRDMATKYFGNEDPMGKLMIIGDTVTYKVTGIAENPPGNSHFKFNLLVSSISAARLQDQIWLNNYLYTYIILNEHGSIENVKRGLDELVIKYVGPEVERFMGVSIAQMKEQGGVYGFFPTKVTDIRLHSTARDGLEPGGNITYVYFFGAVALFIIILACINFMNLATARSAGRAREVGLRKALGSLRIQMVGQFLAESIIYSCLAVVIAVAASYILLPTFNELSGKNLTTEYLTHPWFIGGLVAFILFVGILSGSYPAFYLTSFNAVEVLKGKLQSGMKSKGIRSALVVFQFGISIFLIIFTASVYLQLKFMQNRNLGMDKENVLIVGNTWRLSNNRQAFRNAIDGHSGVEKTSFTNNTFPGVNNTTVFKAADSDQDHIMGVYYADYEHADVLKLEMVAGRFFSRDFPSDSSAIILNEAAAREFAWEDPLREEILYLDQSGPRRLRVIGIMKDFNFESLKEQIRPLAILFADWGGDLAIRYEGNPAGLVGQIEDLWKSYAPNEPFEYFFLDQNFDELFRAEQRLGSIFTILSGLAIFVAGLGLFALAAFTGEQRTREIGIRKVMGANVSGLVYLLSREFTVLVLMAFIPGAVLGWYVVNEWLASFAYRTTISPWVFILSGVASIILAWLTVGFQALKAASTNPANALRYE